MLQLGLGLGLGPGNGILSFFFFFFFVNVVDIICCALLACIVDVHVSMTSSGMKRGEQSGSRRTPRSECMLVGRNSMKLNLVGRGLKSKFGVNP